MIIIQYNLNKARAAIVLGVDVNMKAEKSRLVYYRAL